MPDRMPFHPFILASEDPLFRVIGVVIVMIIWGISAMSKAMKGKPKSVQTPAVAPRKAAPAKSAPRPVTVARPARLPAAQKNLPRVQGAAAMPARGGTLPPLPQLQRAKPPVPVQRVAKVNRPAAAAPVSAPSQVTAVKPAVVAGWLRPGAVRSQIILAEIFKPPLALREKQ
jgi:hypothetical protein